MRRASINSLWGEIFKKYSIPEIIDRDGSFTITADQIKEFKEPRLMTKFDEYSQLPKVFRDRGLSIIADSRGSYLIGRFALFYPLEYKSIVSDYLDSQNLETCNISDLYSESSALMFAYNNGFFEKAFFTEELYFTTYGRMSTRSFTFDVCMQDKDRSFTGERMEISVNRSQIEIDAGFESQDSFYIVEAKNRFVEDINLRQLYYPYRLWSEKTDKKVIPVFFIHHEGNFFIHICEFEDPNIMNSLRIAESFRFVPRGEPISMNDIVELHRNITPRVVTEATFPQADRMEKIMELLSLIDRNDEVTTKMVADFFGFDERQSHYYTTAAIFLGLIERNRGVSKLSSYGKRIMGMKYRDKHLELIKAMLQDEVMYRSFEYLNQHYNLPDRGYVSDLIRTYHPAKNNGAETPNRRAQTCIGWLKWMIDLTQSPES